MKAGWNKAKREAAETLKSFGMTKPPIDPEVIAGAMGIDVVYADFKPDFTEKVSEFIRFNSLQIVVNNAISPNRMMSTIAHELAHYLLHRDYAKSANYQAMPRNNEYSGGKPEEEQEADCFAAELLMPAHMVKEYKDYASSRELARIFAVSEDAILNRLKSFRLS